MTNLKQSIDRVIFAMLLLSLSTFSTIGIIGIVYQATGWRMPNWLAWTILTAGSVSVIVGALATYGGVSVAPWVAKSLLAADTVSV